MNESKISQIRKRDGAIVPFEPDKIAQAIHKALVATGVDDLGLSDELAIQVVKLLEERLGGAMPSVEEVQDVVEEVRGQLGFQNGKSACGSYSR